VADDDHGFKEAPLPWDQRPAGPSGLDFLKRRIVYWWVNQKQTWRHEIQGGYMWSPKRNSNNSFNRFYSNMHLVDTGDLVFSYFNQRIQYVGIVRRPAISWNKPNEFGLVGDYWNHEGWYVAVEWHKVPLPFRPKDLIEKLRPTLPKKYSPLNQESGDGLQNVYLAKVPDEMAAILSAQMGIWMHELEARRRVIGDDTSIESRLDDIVENHLLNDKTVAETEREAVIKARRGQGRYKQNLVAVEDRCRVTGVTDSRLLIASHIKPWRSCSNNEERLDGHNGFLLTPHIDRLFDRGYISFDEDGRVLTSERIAPLEFHKIGIDVDRPPRVGEFSDRQQQYLDYHRNVIFIPSG
jgi:hypothetical protein